MYEVLGGHPLALNWAGSQLAAGDEPPHVFLAALQSGNLPDIHQPGYERHTLRWLYDRSVKHLSADARRLLGAAGLLAQQPFVFSAATAVVGQSTARHALALLVRHGLLRLSDDKSQWQFTHALAHQHAADGADLALLEPLGVWAAQGFDDAVKQTKQSGDFVALTTVLNHAVALLRTDSEQTLLEPLKVKLTYDGADELDSLGRLDLARTAALACFEWNQRTAKQNPSDPDLQRELSVSYDNLGNIHSAAGDLNAARQAFQQSLDIRDKLAKSDPSNSQWQRDLFVSYAQIGDLLIRQNQREEGLKYLQQARIISARLVQLDPANANWKNDLAWVEKRIASLQ